MILSHGIRTGSIILMRMQYLLFVILVVIESTALLLFHIRTAAIAFICEVTCVSLSLLLGLLLQEVVFADAGGVLIRHVVFVSAA